LGELFEGEMASEYRKFYANNMIKSNRSTVAFTYDETQFELEELVAYLFSYAKKQAEAYGETPVTGAVITVPPTLTHFERKAILDVFYFTYTGR
jgi:molecular chaperone DnaK (HSP70)